MREVVLVLTTFPDDRDPHVLRGLAADLVSAGHAACVSVMGPMESTYRWEGKVAVATERQVLIKTTSDRVAALQEAVTTAHPYDVPEWLVIPVAGGGDDYLTWVRG